MVNLRRGKYRYIGGGSSREVYDLNNGYVVKVAKNRAGIEQNKTEYRIYSKDNTGIFAKIVQVSDNYEYVVMKKARKVKRIEEVWKYFNVSNKMEFYNVGEIERLRNKYNLILADINRVSSWGIINGNLVIIDYGFTQAVKRKYY